MIGLGTNRLSASRLAGLREASQFRNGQWLEGAGSWGSPYSAAATRALNAAFSAAQWAIIRDYGWEHPEIVGYMNAYAVEDAKIAYSLVEGIGTRWLVGDGNSWIDIQDIYEMDDILDFESVVDAYITSGSQFNSYMGCYYNADIQGLWLDRSNSRIYISHYGYLPSGFAGVGSIIHAVIGNGTGSVTNVATQSTQTYSYTPYASGTIYPHLGIFAMVKQDGTTAYSNTKGKCRYFKVGSKANLVPFIRKINGVDTLGMIDMKNGVFYQNQGTGTFTELIESPS